MLRDRHAGDVLRAFVRPANYHNDENIEYHFDDLAGKIAAAENRPQELAGHLQTLMRTFLRVRRAREDGSKWNDPAYLSRFRNAQRRTVDLVVKNLPLVEADSNAGVNRRTLMEELLAYHTSPLERARMSGDDAQRHALKAAKRSMHLLTGWDRVATAGILYSRAFSMSAESHRVIPNKNYNLALRFARQEMQYLQDAFADLLTMRIPIADCQQLCRQIDEMDAGSRTALPGSATAYQLERRLAVPEDRAAWQNTSKAVLRAMSNARSLLLQNMRTAAREACGQSEQFLRQAQESRDAAQATAQQFQNVTDQQRIQGLSNALAGHVRAARAAANGASLQAQVARTLGLPASSLPDDRERREDAESAARDATRNADAAQEMAQQAGAQIHLAGNHMAAPLGQFTAMQVTQTMAAIVEQPEQPEQPDTPPDQPATLQATGTVPLQITQAPAAEGQTPSALPAPGQQQAGEAAAVTDSNNPTPMSTDDGAAAGSGVSTSEATWVGAADVEGGDDVPPDHPIPDELHELVTNVRATYEMLNHMSIHLDANAEELGRYMQEHADQLGTNATLRHQPRRAFLDAFEQFWDGAAELAEELQICYQATEAVRQQITNWQLENGEGTAAQALIETLGQDIDGLRELSLQPDVWRNALGAERIRFSRACAEERQRRAEEARDAMLAILADDMAQPDEFALAAIANALRIAEAGAELINQEADASERILWDLPDGHDPRTGDRHRETEEARIAVVRIAESLRRLDEVSRQQGATLEQLRGTALALGLVVPETTDAQDDAPDGV